MSVVNIARDFRGLVFVALSLLAFGTSVSAATIKQPNGSVVDSNEDLRVKVLGGWVAIARSWGVDNVATGGGKWYFNPAWAELKFTFDSLDGSVKSIRRLDAAYVKGGNGIYLFAKQDFIKAVTAPDPANPTNAVWGQVLQYSIFPAILHKGLVPFA